MTAAELRKKLDESLRGDTTGKSTPIQRLAPFLQELVTYLEVTEALATSRYKTQDESFEDHSGLTPPALFGDRVSSNAMTEVATPQTNSENGDASKATP